MLIVSKNPTTRAVIPSLWRALPNAYDQRPPSEYWPRRISGADPLPEYRKTKLELRKQIE